jgi:thiol-disulfide isomerase/thioredoxin
MQFLYNFQHTVDLESYCIVPIFKAPSLQPPVPEYIIQNLSALKKKIFKITLLSVGILLLLAFALRRNIYEFITVKKLSRPAEYFSFTGVSGNKITVDTFKGKVLLLDFWATWCRPCIQSFPSLQKVYLAHKNDPQFAMLAINTGYENSFNDMVQFSIQKKDTYTFPYAYDEKSIYSKFYAKDGIPSYALIDKKGNLRFMHLGYDEHFENFEQDLEKKINKLLAE